MLHPAAVPVAPAAAASFPVSTIAAYPAPYPAAGIAVDPAISDAGGGADIVGGFNASTNATNRRSLGNAASVAVATTGARSNNNVNVSSAVQSQQEHHHCRRHHRQHHRHQQQQRESTAKQCDGRTGQGGADVTAHPRGPPCQYFGLRHQQQHQQHYRQHQQQEPMVSKQREQAEMRRKLAEWYQLHPHLSPVKPVRLPGRPGINSAPPTSSRRR